MSVSHPSDLADATTNELLAMLEIMFLVALADQNFSAQERLNFLEHAESLSEGRIGSKMLTRLIESWEKRDMSETPLRLEELARDLGDHSTRRLAYGLARSLAEADGEVLPAEAQLLATIAEALSLDVEEAEEIAESVAMSSRPS